MLNDQAYRSLAEKRAARRDQRQEDQGNHSQQMLNSLVASKGEQAPEVYQKNDPVTQLLFAATPGADEEEKAKLMMNAGQFGGAAGTALGGAGGAIAGGVLGGMGGAGIGALPGAAAGAGIGSGIGGALGTMAGGSLADVGQNRLDFKTEKQMEDVAKKEAIMSLMGAGGGGRRRR